MCQPLYWASSQHVVFIDIYQHILLCRKRSNTPHQLYKAFAYTPVYPCGRIWLFYRLFLFTAIGHCGLSSIHRRFLVRSPAVLWCVFADGVRKARRNMQVLLVSLCWRMANQLVRVFYLKRLFWKLFLTCICEVPHHVSCFDHILCSIDHHLHITWDSSFVSLLAALAFPLYCICLVLSKVSPSFVCDFMLTRKDDLVYLSCVALHIVFGALRMWPVLINDAILRGVQCVLHSFDIWTIDASCEEDYVFSQYSK